MTYTLLIIGSIIIIIILIVAIFGVVYWKTMDDEDEDNEGEETDEDNDEGEETDEDNDEGEEENTEENNNEGEEENTEENNNEGEETENNNEGEEENTEENNNNGEEEPEELLECEKLISSDGTFETVTYKPWEDKPRECSWKKCAGTAIFDGGVTMSTDDFYYVDNVDKHPICLPRTIRIKYERNPGETYYFETQGDMLKLNRIQDVDNMDDNYLFILDVDGIFTYSDPEVGISRSMNSLFLEEDPAHFILETGDHGHVHITHQEKEIRPGETLDMDGSVEIVNISLDKRTWFSVEVV